MGFIRFRLIGFRVLGFGGFSGLCLGLGIGFSSLGRI